MVWAVKESVHFLS